MEAEKETEPTSMVSRQVKINGDIRGNEGIIVEGFIKGTVKIKGDLLIEASGEVAADIEANNVIIKGRVTGNVVAQDHLVIHPSGIMNGDLYARFIDIKEGSSFEGRSHMIKNS